MDRGADIIDESMVIVGTKDTNRCDVSPVTAMTRASARTCGTVGPRTGTSNMMDSGRETGYVMLLVLVQWLVVKQSLLSRRQ